jgi:branched-subunit amino acid aminotransferase/4-amino-4-deoxychorismate lyase
MVDEAFITSSLRGVEPIASIDGRQLLSPGPLTSRAQRAFRALEEKCSDP